MLWLSKFPDNFKWRSLPPEGSLHITSPFSSVLLYWQTGELLFSRALSLHGLITLDHFKASKLYKILFEGLLNDGDALLFPVVFLVVFIMPYIFLGRVSSQLYLWSQVRIYGLQPSKSPSGFVIRDRELSSVWFLRRREEDFPSSKYIRNCLFFHSVSLGSIVWAIRIV